MSSHFPLRNGCRTSQFEVGRHGIILVKDGRRAVFLPDVAVEQGWDREQTLTRLAQKAGLPPDGWRDGAQFFVFTNHKFRGPVGNALAAVSSGALTPPQASAKE